MDIKRVLISDEITHSCVEILQRNGIEAVKKPDLGKNKAALLEEIKDYDALIVRSTTKVTDDVISAGMRLKLIGRAGTGVDNIDAKAATMRGVIVMNTPGGNTISAAEHTCALLLSMARHVVHGHAGAVAGQWEVRKKLVGVEVQGKVLAIIGLGRIGQEVAQRMQAFGMTTIGFDPLVSPEDAAAFGVKWLNLDDIWPQADFVTVHTPLIPQTKGLLNDDVFSRCKKTLRVINCARGGIIDEDAMLRALNDGRCAGAALDVFCSEPPQCAELLRHPLVTATPHLGASTKEAQLRVAEDIAQQIVDFTNGKSLFGAINGQAYVGALKPENKPLTDLALALSRVGAAMMRNDVKNAKIAVTLFGDKFKAEKRLLEAAVLIGALSSSSTNGLNYISAPAVANDMGISITVATKDGDDRMEVEMKNDDVTHSVSGELGAHGVPQLLSLDGSQMQGAVTLKGTLLVVKTGQINDILASCRSEISQLTICGESTAIVSLKAENSGQKLLDAVGDVIMVTV